MLPKIIVKINKGRRESAYVSSETFQKKIIRTLSDTYRGTLEHQTNILHFLSFTSQTTTYTVKEKAIVLLIQRFAV